MNEKPVFAHELSDRKGVSTRMKYTKPEVTLLGPANEVIQSSEAKQNPLAYDGHALATTSAYEADE